MKSTFNQDGKYDNVNFHLFRRFWEGQALTGKAPMEATHPRIPYGNKLALHCGQQGNVTLTSPNTEK